MTQPTRLSTLTHTCQCAACRTAAEQYRQYKGTEPPAGTRFVPDSALRRALAEMDQRGTTVSSVAVCGDAVVGTTTRGGYLSLYTTDGVYVGVLRGVHPDRDQDVPPQYWYCPPVGSLCLARLSGTPLAHEAAALRCDVALADDLSLRGLDPDEHVSLDHEAVRSLRRRAQALGLL